jgi:hypothetical protein
MKADSFFGDVVDALRAAEGLPDPDVALAVVDELEREASRMAEVAMSLRLRFELTRRQVRFAANRRAEIEHMRAARARGDRP